MTKIGMDRKEFETELVKNFPLFYKDMHGPANQTCMHWGVDIGPGWYDLLWELSEKLEKIAQSQPENHHITASQVKEKFAQLRIYTYNFTDEADKLIDEAEVKSLTVCEECGKDGQEHAPFKWHVTLCDEHLKKYIEKRTKG